MDDILHLSREDLDLGLDEIRLSPSDQGGVEMIVARPAVNERLVLEVGELDEAAGLVGDCWCRNDKNPETQLTLMNSRLIALVAGERDRWPLAGDQIVVDFDLGSDNLPTGTRIEVGTAIVEVTAEPHLGCRKFASRYGKPAMLFVNSDEGKRLRLRGVNVKIVRSGSVRVGDQVRKLPSPEASGV